jgi:hypothetical protein
MMTPLHRFLVEGIVNAAFTSPGGNPISGTFGSDDGDARRRSLVENIVLE